MTLLEIQRNHIILLKQYFDTYIIDNLSQIVQH